MEESEETEEDTKIEPQKVNEFIGSIPSPAVRQFAWIEDEGAEGSIIFSWGNKKNGKVKTKK